MNGSSLTAAVARRLQQAPEQQQQQAEQERPTGKTDTNCKVLEGLACKVVQGTVDKVCDNHGCADDVRLDCCTVSSIRHHMI